VFRGQSIGCIRCFPVGLGRSWGYRGGKYSVRRVVVLPGRIWSHVTRWGRSYFVKFSVLFCV
jgi:hypothetical protein